MVVIQKIDAREVLDSRGNPTVEATVFTSSGSFSAMVPSGASTGIHEALELRDKDSRFGGKGVLKAIKNIKLIEKKLKGMDCTNQKELDQTMIDLDGTDNKSKLGANAILAVSLASARAAAHAQDLPLYKYLQKISNTKTISPPIAFFNVINGGKHADNALDFQEFMIAPHSTSFRERLRIGAEVYHELKKIVAKKYGKDSTNVGDEGGFAPNVSSPEEPLELLTKSVEELGYQKEVKFALDVAASDFYNKKAKTYTINKKSLSADKLTDIYLDLIKNYPIISIEDPFDEDNFEEFAALTKKTSIQVVGDDLLVTNPKRIQHAIDKKSCNALLLKVNQIGTLTESIQASNLAKKAGWNVMVSHRSGETEDTFIADLVVGLNTQQIKSGAPCRGERTAKYNRLLKIEEEMAR